MNESTFIRHEPCHKCGSSDAGSRYSDGHFHCFSCSHWEAGEALPSDAHRRPKMSADLITGGELKALNKRQITEETVRKFGYRSTEYGGKSVQVAPYYDAEGNVVAQKVRFPDKTFTVLGKLKDALPLFGQHLWGQGGKKIVVTEGEIDALTVSQLQSNKWPVVSVPNGSDGALASLKKALEWLETFEEVILMFDMDEPGRKATAACAELFTPGKCKVASLPRKDPNDCLVNGQGDAVIGAVWQAKVHRPDGIVVGTDLFDEIMREDSDTSTPYPWEGLNDKLRGLRRSELVTITSGSGMGKSAIVRELAFHLIKNTTDNVGMIMLEEDVRRTALGLMGLDLNKPLHINRDGVDEDMLKLAFQSTVGCGRMFLYDHFGSTEVSNLLSRVRYMARSLDCKWVFLDHLSIVVSGLGDGDERRLIDNTMTSLRTLVQETGIGLVLVSHLKRPEGKGHEEGAKTSLSQLRGSHAIAQLSDTVIGAERDQQGDDPNLTTLRVLKNRFSGQTGEACLLRYSHESGRLTEADNPFTDQGSGEKPDF